MNGLQKSPHHKSTSALNDLISQHPQPPVSASNSHLHVPLSATQSLLYQQNKHTSVHSETSAASDFSESPSFGYPDDLELSPPSSVLSANASVVSQGRKWDDHQRLRDFDLAEEYLQHFGRDQRERHSPIVTTGVGSTGKPPAQRQNQPFVSSGQHFNYPTPSPTSRYQQKRSSTPELTLEQSGYHYRTSSPDPYLPAPDFLQYSSSYQPPSHMQQARGGGAGNMPQRGGGGAGHPGPRQSVPHAASGYKASSGASCWYDNEFEYSGHEMNFHRHTPPPGARSMDAPNPRAKLRKASEESYDLQEMLRIWAESKQNPFGEGTLV